MRRAKIICTLGPASKEPAFIGDLIDEGMNVARINFSHGTAEDHTKTIASVRSEAEKRGRAVAVLQDLQGPKIRIGKFKDGQIDLESGADFTITTEEILGDVTRASTTYKSLPADVKPGNVLLLDDGLFSLEVVDVDRTEVHTRVLVGGILKNNKGINLPGVMVSAPALTVKDREDLALGMKLGVDFIALSFVRTAEDVKEAVKLATYPNGKRVPIIAKIERPEAVDNLEEIIDAADGIMVARGDLGVEMGAEKVPLIQKRLIEETNKRGKVVITATQMLESMITNQRPTRAEASDVANAVLDGSDALMLSGETASGRYPLLAVRTMARIIEEIEASTRFRSLFDAQTLDLAFTTNAIAKSAVVASRQLGAAAIVCISDSGAAARLVAEYRPEARIIAITSHPEIYHRLALYWGVEALMAQPAKLFSEMLSQITDQLVSGRFVKSGDLLAITVALPVGSKQSTNSLHLLRVP